jgi:4-amino-4-deoxy-L-arabinose transferase-like glycosyltransferase
MAPMWGRRIGAVRSRGGFWSAVVGSLAAYLGLGLWDVFHYNWERGYDAWASSLYVNTIQVGHHLPGVADTGVWHNPPLFFWLAALIQQHLGWLGLEPHKAVQLLSVFSGFGTVVFSFLIARQVFPTSRWIQLTTLLVAALTPVLLRGSLMYHPDPLSTVLATAGVYLAVRAASGRWSVRLGIGSGVLLGLANLTRAWALAETVGVLVVCFALWLWNRRPEILRFVGACTAAFVILSFPWYERQWIDHGSPVAFAKPGGPGIWLPSGRPLRFYTTLDLGDVFTNPYQPTYKNLLLPVLYTDWWGDYARYFHIPLAKINKPRQLPSKYREPLVLQSIVGTLPTLLAIAGAVGLAVESVRRRRASVAIVLASAGLVALSFIGFLVQDPKVDGDNIKALYVIDLVPAVALCIAWALDWVRRRANRPLLIGVLAWLAVTACYDLNFMVLR